MWRGLLLLSSSMGVQLSVGRKGRVRVREESRGRMRRKTALKKQEKVFQSRENRTNRCCCCCDFLQYRKTPPFLPFSSRCEVNRWHRLLKSYWRLDVKTSWTNLPSSCKRDELNLSNNKQAKRNPHFPQSYRAGAQLRRKKCS